VAFADEFTSSRCLFRALALQSKDTDRRRRNELSVDDEIHKTADGDLAETIEDTLGQDVHSFQIVRQEWLARGALPADAEISIAPGLADAEGRPTATRRTSISRTI
jgi:hypothetical protein